MGSGSVIAVSHSVDAEGWKEGLIITANHVVERNDDGIRVRYENRKEAVEGKVVARDRDSDVAVVAIKVPGEVDAVGIATRDIKEGDLIEFVGRNRRKYSGEASILCYPNQSWMDAVAMPGDSGGAVLLDGRLAGVISGGVLWAPNEPQRTWPTRACNTDVTVKVIKKAKEAVNWSAAVTSSKIPKIKEYEAGDLKEEVTQLIVFSASWCMPCKRLKADIEKYLEDLNIDRIVFVDCDKERKLAQANKVRVYPTVMLVRNSDIIERLEGPSITKLISATKRLK